MNHTIVPARPGHRLRRTVAGVALGSVVALSSTAAHATSYDRPHDGDDRIPAITYAAHYSFRTIDNPADPTFNQLLGINDRGRIVGYFGSGADAAHPNQGYRVKPSSDRPRFRAENVPNSVQTQVVGINDDGTTVGFFVDHAGANIGFVARGGHFTSVANPATASAAPFDQLLGINRHGIAVGFYNDADGAAHGYTYDTRAGTFTPVVLPIAADAVTATGINDAGDVSGFYVSGKTTSGFLLHRGHVSRLAFGGQTNTQALGVNDAGRVVGSYLDAGGAMHGFVWSRQGGLVTIDAPNGTGGTLVNGLNNAGQLVGFYVDAADNTHGFVARR